MKKTLVIHPDDRSTDFLIQIYKDINNKTVVRGGKTKEELQELIKTHDRIIMCGHGSPFGLWPIGEWVGNISGNLIDIRDVELLKEKTDCYYIWCNANQFVERHNLKGFYTGMFISEVSEASWYDIDVDQETVDTSNDTFSQLVGKYIKRPIKQTYKKVLQEYESLIENNEVASYNHERLYFR